MAICTAFLLVGQCCIAHSHFTCTNYSFCFSKSNYDQFELYKLKIFYSLLYKSDSWNCDLSKLTTSIFFPHGEKSNSSTALDILQMTHIWPKIYVQYSVKLYQIKQANIQTSFVQKREVQDSGESGLVSKSWKPFLFLMTGVTPTNINTQCTQPISTTGFSSCYHGLWTLMLHYNILLRSVCFDILSTTTVTSFY